MATLSLISGNCGRGRGDGNGLIWHFSNKFLAGDVHGRLRLRNFEAPRLGNHGRNFRVVAGVRKGKKHDYPWPDNIDPNSNAPLTYLSYFKPLEEKPKPVTLAFEKPLIDLEQKIIEVQRMASDTGLDFTDQIKSLEMKYEQALKDLYTHLTPIQRLSIARHPNRPTVLDHILNITEKWVELHGDRAGYDDPAIVAGIGSIEGRSYMFIGHQKGRNTKENIMRNFAMPTPHGYRKALRMMRYADHHGFPIITFVDTPGAFADLKSEELGQGEAIAYNLRTMFGLKVPIITVVTGEGGSGGALAIACANKLLMLENSAFYVASPEACAAILWKSSKAAPKAAEKLRITAQEHYKLKIADAIIPEPLGGAHADPLWSSLRIKDAILQEMEELTRMTTKELLEHRRLKFRAIGLGGFKEDPDLEPERKRNMKASEVGALRFKDIESEIDGLKKTILEAKGPSDPITVQKLEKLEEDLDNEMTKAFISMGLADKIESLNLELARSPNPDKALNEDLKERADEIVQEIKRNLARPGEYLVLKGKLQTIEIANKLLEAKASSEKLKIELNQKLLPEIKQKFEALKRARENLARGDALDEDLASQVEEAKEELEEVLRSAKLEVVGTTKREALNPLHEVREEMARLDREIKEEIKNVIDKKGLGLKIDELREEAVKDPNSEKVRKMEAEIREEIAAELVGSPLRERLESLRRLQGGSPDMGVVQENVGLNNGTARV
ncbi:acetyl-coenzyme A carboxylase carboxyl transferase subunit alpha, chloroplastic-like [Salvia splendens]|uniref:acetyl-coenzyme A carboxylase carboxyl transferase subunit alpha, chloroplastic-like n=1 Tax=Salvia splendens TaxID=180675 RepID=UPI001C25B216|nr:acetyl-coenzyme A carboxylase carboxyl transferase subunit alpha, chloroplastic-like [Salvia splendens]XP_042039229.1 acetyl-coenzyme A carboxylase carboxyl transferase subunit alpha, chloroplastic-like [Salvia splendens]